jgi:predicted PurR-regulated permease PerM
VAYRTVLLAATLVLLAFAFRQLATLAVAVLATVMIALLLSGIARPLERHGVPRPIGALVALLALVSVLVALLALIIPPFVDQTNTFVDNVPAIADDIEERVHDATGLERSEIGNSVQKAARRYTDEPQRLIGPLTSIGFGVAGVLAALVLMLFVAYYIAANPKPLEEGVLRLFPPARREHARHVMGRMQEAWIGWMRGVGIDMVVTGVLLYVGLWLIGLDYAIVFAVVSALLVLIPYYGAFIGAIPPVLFALGDSPGKAALALAVYVAVQQIEGNVTIPLVMARTLQLHPAVIAVGVLVVGQLFGFAGLFVAVPVLSFITIGIEEFWIKPMETRPRRELVLPGNGDLDPAAPPAPFEPLATEASREQ